MLHEEMLKMQYLCSQNEKPCPVKLYNHIISERQKEFVLQKGGNRKGSVPVLQVKSGGRGNKIPQRILKSNLQLQATGGRCENILERDFVMYKQTEAYVNLKFGNG